ncbi:hypothetical protein A2Z33_02945 [Candidatus Gottesmanbacteria bacterium RBG_16_52_11]|uniref:Glycosyltransferase 2-like domain-containing protein n=1 Tax=Candidatus Gottesmanbacteria bacterium RBG_16_52_11 TaxID=1798374 RepID=A0A1F5YML1_9BACT|nr:MAG: hypothetical protein A2Z33_02945 [Candidatus Gottesmanbacteria bacterium RBG_16_52_11]
MKQLPLTVSVIIPNRNGVDLLKLHLPQVMKACAGCEVIVVDDASSDQSVEFVREKFPGITVLQLPRHSGFSSAVNRGVTAANGEIAVLLNTDTVPASGFLAPLLTHFQDDAVFAVGCLDRSHENGHVVTRGRGIAVWEKGFYLHRRGNPESRESAWVSGGSGVFKTAVWRMLGGMDEIYAPFYWEDVDLS